MRAPLDRDSDRSSSPPRHQSSKSRRGGVLWPGQLPRPRLFLSHSRLSGNFVRESRFSWHTLIAIFCISLNQSLSTLGSDVLALSLTTTHVVDTDGEEVVLFVAQPKLVIFIIIFTFSLALPACFCTDLASRVPLLSAIVLLLLIGGCRSI